MPNTETTYDGQLSATNTYQVEHGDQGADVVSFVALYGTIGFDFDSRTHVGWPAASHLGHVFPAYLTSAIVKANSKAWLKASFGYDPTKCELEIFVSTSETQYIAKELFDVHIVTNDQRRGIRLDSGVFMNIEGSLIMSGSPPERLEKMLGTQVAEAYQLSPSRIEELNNGQTKVTRCLRMEIWPELDCPSRLRLWVEVGKLSVISGRLWPSTQQPAAT
jgi:hypothetical protein